MHCHMCTHTHTHSHSHAHTTHTVWRQVCTVLITYLEYDLSISVDVSLVAIDHTECHGIIGSLWDVLHQLECLFQIPSLHSSLLSGLLEVPEKQLVLCDSLDWLDEVGVNSLSQLMLILNLLLENIKHPTIDIS